MRNHSTLPRVLRLRDAPAYLGMDKNRFNIEVRPYIDAIAIGKQGVAFDRLDLDAWFEQYKSCEKRLITKRRSCLWDAKKRQASRKEAKYGTLTNGSADAEFKKVLEQIHSKKPNAT